MNTNKKTQTILTLGKYCKNIVNQNNKLQTRKLIFLNILKKILKSKQKQSFYLKQENSFVKKVRKKLFSKSFFLGLTLGYLILCLLTIQPSYAVVFLANNERNNQSWKEWFNQKVKNPSIYVNQVKKNLQCIDFELITIGVFLGVSLGLFFKEEIESYFYNKPTNSSLLEKYRLLNLPLLPRARIPDVYKFMDQYRQQNNFADQHMDIQRLLFVLLSNTKSN